MKHGAWGLLVLSLAAGCAGKQSTARVGDVAVRTFRRAYANAHVVERGGARVLVDSGYGEEAEALDRDLRKAGIDPAQLKAIVVTHAHADHAGGAKWFHERYGTRVIAGAADRATLAGGENRDEEFCPQGVIGKQRLNKDRSARFAPFAADVWIDRPTELGPLVGFEGVVVPLPSHTPGSIALVSGQAALVGDLFRGSLLGSGTEIHFFMCDLAANRADVRRLLSGEARDASLFFPGHFGPLARDAVLARFPD